MKRISLSALTVLILIASMGILVGQSEFEPLAICEGAQEYYDTVAVGLGDQMQTELITAIEHLQSRDTRAFFASMEAAEGLAEDMQNASYPECAAFAHERFVLSDTEFLEAWYAIADSDNDGANEHLRWAWRYAGEARGYLVAYGVTVREQLREEQEEGS